MTRCLAKAEHLCYAENFFKSLQHLKRLLFKILSMKHGAWPSVWCKLNTCVMLQNFLRLYSILKDCGLRSCMYSIEHSQVFGKSWTLVLCCNFFKTLQHLKRLSFKTLLVNFEAWPRVWQKLNPWVRLQNFLRLYSILKDYHLRSCK